MLYLLNSMQAVAKVTASERQMAAKYKTQQEAADEWLRRAELAVRKGQVGASMVLQCCLHGCMGLL